MSILRSLRPVLAKVIHGLQGWQMLPSGRGVASKLDTFSSRAVGYTLLRKILVLFLSICIAFYVFSLLLVSGDSRSASPWALLGYQPTDRYSLLASVNYNSTLIKEIKKGSYYKVSPEVAAQPWRKPMTFDDPFAMEQVPAAPPLKEVYTYFSFDMDQLKKEHMSFDTFFQTIDDLQVEVEMLRTWSRAWWALGFTPKVLNASHAMQHPKFDAFMESTLSPEIKKSHVKWLAWLSVGAGIYSDYRVLPMTRNINHDAIQLLKSEEFTGRYTFSESSMSLVLADLKSVSSLASDIMEGQTERELQSSFQVYHQDVFAFYSNRNINTVKGGSPMEEKDLKIPRAEVLDMMNTHLRQAFLTHYPNGIGYVHSEASSLPLVIAHNLNNCPDNEYVNHCPPTPITLHNLGHNPDSKKLTSAKDACAHLVCSTYGNKVKSVQTLSGLPSVDSDTYTIASVMHPWTQLASVQEAEITVDDVRRQPVRNSIVRGLTNGILGSDAIGNDVRLLALKDAMYQRSGLSGISWILFRFDPQDILNSLEYDLGLNLNISKFIDRRLSNKNHPLAGFIGSKTALTEDFIQRADLRIENDLDKSDYIRKVHTTPHKDEVFDAVKAWHPADYEIWRYLYKWSTKKLGGYTPVILYLDNLSMELLSVRGH